MDRHSSGNYYGGRVSEDATVLCRLHNKMRRACLCVKVHIDNQIQWECTPTTRCKEPARTSTPTSKLIPTSVQDAYALMVGYGMGLISQDPSQQTWPVVLPQVQHAAEYNESYNSGEVSCSIHNKKRSIANVVEIYPGVYRCKSESECKLAKANNTYCSIHGRLRKPQFLEPIDSEGKSFRCKQDSLCKLPGSTMVGSSQILDADVSSTSYSPSITPANNVSAMCSKHDRSRHICFLKYDQTTNTYSCTPGNECKMPSKRPEQ